MVRDGDGGWRMEDAEGLGEGVIATGYSKRDSNHRCCVRSSQNRGHGPEFYELWKVAGDWRS